VVGSQKAETAQNATITFNVPRENVNAFGFSGQLDRPQLDAADATFEFSMIPQDSTETPTLTAAIFQGWMTETKANAPTRITSCVAGGVGQIDNALINSISAEASIGAMATMSAGFTGTPNASVPQSVASTNASTMQLVTSKDVTLDSDLGLACAQSASMAWDLPVETILCLGKDPATAANVHTFGNPPGTASITIEGLDSGLAYTAVAANYAVKIGAYTWTLTNGRVDSQTNSLAVGDVFGTFNYVIAGTADGYSVA
tara:strand:+ start:450 stop:1223 length:774 start_codon:yes stop_codon:yes gene_type:complete